MNIKMYFVARFLLLYVFVSYKHDDFSAVEKAPAHVQT